MTSGSARRRALTPATSVFVSRPTRESVMRKRTDENLSGMPRSVREQRLLPRRDVRLDALHATLLDALNLAAEGDGATPHANGVVDAARVAMDDLLG